MLYSSGVNNMSESSPSQLSLTILNHLFATSKKYGKLTETARLKTALHTCIHIRFTQVCYHIDKRVCQISIYACQRHCTVTHRYFSQKLLPLTLSFN